LTAPDVRTPGEVGTGQALKDHENTNVTIVAPVADDGKVLATIKAKLAMAGHAVHDLADGGFLICKCMCRHCRSLAELQAAARQVLGGAGRGGSTV